jgi:hypothetical protein
VSGNNVSQIEPVLEALCKHGNDITPKRILEVCVARQEFAYPGGTVVCTGGMTDELRAKMVQGVLHNLPKLGDGAKKVGRGHDSDDAYDG